MALQNQYLEHIVTIYSNDKRIGVGFIVDEKDDKHFVLTCKHVIYSDKYKDTLSINGKKFNPIENENIFLSVGIDLAILIVDKIDQKKKAFLQKKVQNDSLTISTYHNIDSYKNKFFHKNIDVQIELETSLNYENIDFIAFKLKVEKSLEAGYSGSPIFDTYTNHVIGVLSIKDGANHGYAIDIINIKKLKEDIDVKEFKDETALEESEDVARVVFDGSGDSYKITINQKNLFDGKSIDIIEKESDIAKEIKNYCNYVENVERVFPIEKIELVLPRELFYKNVGSWKDENGENLVSEYAITIRDKFYYNLSLSHQIIVKTEWDKLDKKQELKDISQEINENYMRDPSKKSTHIIYMVDKDTEFDKFIQNFYIAIWTNGYDDIKNYKEFLEKVLKENIEGFPEKFRTQLVKQNCCTKNLSLMWNDPTTLIKSNYRQP